MTILRGPDHSPKAVPTGKAYLALRKRNFRSRGMQVFADLQRKPATIPQLNRLISVSANVAHFGNPYASHYLHHCIDNKHEGRPSGEKGPLRLASNCLQIVFPVSPA